MKKESSSSMKQILLIITLIGILFLYIDPSYAKKRKRRKIRRKPKWTWESKGEVRLESRRFSEDHINSNNDFNLGGAFRVDVKGKKRKWSSALRYFGRMDVKDPQRTTGYIEDAYIAWENNSFRFLLGSQVVNWSATEAFHPADVLNSKNLDGEVERAEKQGEPMASFSYIMEDGTFTLYYMPMALSPIFAKSPNRLSLIPASLTSGKTLWAREDKGFASNQSIPQYGAKFDYSFDSADFSLIYLDHQDRSQPLSVLNGSTVHAVFLPVKLSALTLQYDLAGLLIKSEVAHKDFPDEAITDNSFIGQSVKIKDHQQVALGFEYTWSHDSGWESTFLVEGQLITGVEKDERLDLSVFQNDALIGYRIAINDVHGQEWFISAMADLEYDHENIYQVSYSRRLSDVWKTKYGIRHVHAPQKGSSAQGLEAMHEDSYVTFELSRFF